MFQFEDLKDGVSFVRELRRPSIQLRDADFAGDEDLPEVLTDSAQEKLEREIAESYSGQIAQELDEALARGEFEALILCAESRLLGILRDSLSPSVHGRVSGMIDQDLYNINESDLVNYLRDLETRRSAA
ncbi:MAG: host attachment protein [Oligoflexia bacterium]|nr:host attachment protein [Oligoflexia bacterium]